jgi:hypothetical protein
VFARCCRRFCALVEAHGWRAAALRHWPDVCEALLAARGGTAVGIAPAEWKATYKMLTFLPWAVLQPEAERPPFHLQAMRRRATEFFGYEPRTCALAGIWQGPSRVAVCEPTFWCAARMHLHACVGRFISQLLPSLTMQRVRTCLCVVVRARSGEGTYALSDDAEAPWQFLWRGFCPRFADTELHTCVHARRFLAACIRPCSVAHAHARAAGLLRPLCVTRSALFGAHSSAAPAAAAAAAPQLCAFCGHGAPTVQAPSFTHTADFETTVMKRLQDQAAEYSARIIRVRCSKCTHACCCMPSGGEGASLLPSSCRH